MTGEFYGEVMARIKNPVDGNVFLACLYLLIKVMFKKQDGGSLDCRWR
jgi:hypothetical protein